MGILTGDMKRLVDEQKLAFHATVCPDGSPNLSPKGSTRVWDDDHLFFADICSPQTIANIRAGSLVEVNVVDPFVRKGYRFKGRAVIHEPGDAVFAEGIERMRADGSKLTGRVTAIVMIEVQDAAPLVSPAYDDGMMTEADMLETQRTTEAAGAVLAAAAQAGIGQVLALTDLDNAPSQAVAARLGMRDEGTTDRWFGLTSRQFRRNLHDHEGFSTV